MTRVAIAGAGLMGRWHARACRRAGGRIVAIIDPDLDAARRLANAHAAAALRSLDDLPGGALPQLVHVCSPADSHEAAVLASFARGCVVLVEKPVAPSADATSRLIEAGRTAGLWMEPVHQLIFQRGVQRALHWLRGMGPVRVFEYRVCSAGAAASEAGADVIAEEILPHPLSLIDTFLPGELDRLDRWHVVRPSPGELTASAAASASTITLSISMHGRPPRHDLTVVAEGGTITMDLFHGFAHRQSPRTGRAQKALRPFTASAAGLAAAAINLARRGVDREWAYPGLTALVERTYTALGNPAARPLGDRHLLAVAQARDRLLGR